VTAGLGGLIVDRRRELGMTQQDLARRLGVPTANLSQIEHSPSRWRSRLLWALAAELHLPQLELALAAGVITDLPILDGTTGQGTNGFDDLVLAYLSGDEEIIKEPPGRSRLLRLVDKLEPEDAEFLASIARQLIARRRTPDALPIDTSVGDLVDSL
jgi:transcriptional regulator with XRE-family HTH domain